MENNISIEEQNQAQIQDQPPQQTKKPIKKIIGIILLVAFIIFAVVPFLITAVTFLLLGLSQKKLLGQCFLCAVLFLLHTHTVQGRRDSGMSHLQVF